MKIAFLICFLVAFVHSSVLVPRKDNVFGTDLAKPVLELDEGDWDQASARGRSSEEDSDSSSSESGSDESGEKPTTTRRTTTTKRTTTTRPTTTKPTTTTRPTTTRRTTTTPRPTTTRRTTTTRPTTTRPTTTTTTTPKPTTTTTTTPKPTTTSTPPPPPTTTEFPAECKIVCRKGDHYLVNPANCNSFYQCSNMTPIYQPCPPDLVFDPSINVCVTKNSYHCEETCDRVEVLYRTKAG